MRHVWLRRYGVSVTILTVFAVAGMACLVWWVPIATRWHVRRLASDREPERLSAQQALIDLGPPAIPTLVHFTDHSSRRVRLGVARAFAGMDTDEALDRLAPMMRDHDFEIRRLAAWTLLSHDAALQRTGLDIEIDDPDPALRLCAVRMVSRRDFAHAVDRLISALTDESNLVRLAAIRELRGLTGKSFQFDAFSRDAARADAVARWRAWWEAERAHLPASRAQYLADPSVA